MAKGEDKEDDSFPYIIFLPEADGITYSYDGGHHSDEFSTSEYQVLLHFGPAKIFYIESKSKMW